MLVITACDETSMETRAHTRGAMGTELARAARLE
jgi:hypothetical protein